MHIVLHKNENIYKYDKFIFFFSIKFIKFYILKIKTLNYLKI